jgi:YfiH family protein
VYISPEPTPGGAHVWFFTRLGGVSEPPFDSLNVSRSVGDDDEAVERNLSLIKEAVGGLPSAWARQVHSNRVARVSEPGFAGEADALVTGEAGFALAVAVADCVPVALVGEREVGMVHSGWRGTIAGITTRTAEEMDGDGLHALRASLRAYIGPCIRECCYEVSGELAGRFVKRFGAEVVSGRNLSLPGAIKKDLEELGVEVHDLGICTACRTDLFYSHRRQGPATGRNLAVVARTGG